MTECVYVREYNISRYWKKGAFVMDNNKKSKYDRILSLYEEFKSGGIVRKAEEANKFGVSERIIQRDIDDIRAFFDNNSVI